MSKETAIEWLIGELNGYDEDCEIFQIAKAMEREQITEAHLQGLYSDIKMKGEKQAEQYYNETYKGGEQC